MGITSLKDQGEKMKNQTIPTDGDLDSLYKRNGVMNINPELEGIEKYKKLSMIIDGKESETFKNSRPVNEKSKQFMESYINYCKNFEILKNKGLGIAMSGNAGTGKTYLLNERFQSTNSLHFDLLDIDNYRQNRRSVISQIAQEAVAEVQEHGDEVALDPMNPFERKVVHDIVAKAGLVSDSEGVGPTRHVVIKPVEAESEVSA